MKLFGLIAIVLLSFSACQKENFRHDCPSDRTSETTENAVEPQASSISSRPENNSGNTDNVGGGIVDPNADQDSNTNTSAKTPKKR